MTLRPLIPAVLALALAACASASHVMISDPRPPIPVEQVRLYLSAPQTRYVEIAILDASSGDFTYGAQNRTDTLMLKLRTEAAKLGANGVLLQDRAQVSSGSGVGVGVGGGSYHGGGGFSSGGVSFGINPPKELAHAIAIYVPDASGS
ncbi:hypothetical protein [Cognatilysobacter terrigena]|uniref:hypothetical protein n=1 Tax=Cognatilysobacter terrigena TaxID=2488749 RepID=UPI00105C85F0|nr:hypothetical protein [Lysobacter terrigena]